MPDVESPWIERKTERFTVSMLAGDGFDPVDDNVDIEVELACDGQRWGATIFTLANLDSLMRRWEHSGECGGGRYFWAHHAVIVKELTPDGVVQVIEALLDADEFRSAKERLDRNGKASAETGEEWADTRRSDGGGCPVEKNPPSLVYEPLVYVDRQTTERDLASGDEQLVARALLAASLEDDDAAWVLDRCLAMVDDPRVGVRRAVALAIGHLAIPGDFVDAAAAREALKRLAADPVVRPAASDALADVEHALTIRPEPGT